MYNNNRKKVVDVQSLWKRIRRQDNENQKLKIAIKNYAHLVHYDGDLIQ